MKPRDRLLTDYWSGLAEVLDKGPGETFPHPTERQMKENWIAFPFPVRGCSLRVGVGTKRTEIWVYLIFAGTRRRQHFRALEQARPELEKKLGGVLDCDAADHTASSQVRIRRPDSDIRDRATWPEQHAWIARTLRAFLELVPSRIEPGADYAASRASADRVPAAVTLTFMVPATLKRRLEQEAARRGQATTDYARTVLEEKLFAE